MIVTLLKNPYSVSFSKNPMPFTWQVNPYTQVEQKADIKVTVRVLVEKVFLSGTFQEVYLQKIYPDAVGKISIDVSTIINPYLNFYTPRLDLSTPVQCTGQTIRYRVDIVPEGPGMDLPLYGAPSTYYAIKGGLAYEAWHYKEFFTKVILEQKKPLLFSAAGERTDVDAKRFFHWLTPDDDFLEQTIVYKIYLSDGTIVTKNNFKITSRQWVVNCVPAGFIQSGLKSLVPADKTAVKYSISVITAPDTIVVNEYFYSIDYRTFYEPYYILYRNSLGALETKRLTGEVDKAADYNAQQAMRTVPPAWYNPHLISQIKDEATEENISFSGDTGFMSKDEEMKLRDMLLSVQKWMVQSSILNPQPSILPIAFTNKAIKFTSNKERMYSAAISWQLAFINTLFTPAGLMPQSRTCPAVDKFIVTQSSKNTLNFLWSLEMPYAKIEVQVIVDAVTSIFTYKLNSGMATQAVQGLTDVSQNIQVKARTICNSESYPVEYGPFSTVNFETTGKSLPVAVDDYYQLPVGFYGELPFSILLNDYDPDGDAIEAISTWGIFDDAGNASPGTYTIYPQGLVVINTPVGFFGQHSIPYAIHNPGSPDYVTGTMHLNFGTGPQNVYVKWVFRNVTTTADYTAAEAWIDYYSDAACTVPVDITGLGITINAKKVATGTSTGENTWNFVGAGTKIKLVGYETISTVSPYMKKIYTVLPGTGYIPVNP